MRVLFWKVCANRSEYFVIPHKAWLVKKAQSTIIMSAINSHEWANNLCNASVTLIQEPGKFLLVILGNSVTRYIYSCKQKVLYSKILTWFLQLMVQIITETIFLILLSLSCLCKGTWSIIKLQFAWILNDCWAMFPVLVVVPFSVASGSLIQD